MVNTGEWNPTLGTYVRERRERLGMTVIEAAEHAGVARGTWINVESDSRKTLPHNYAGIERALRWAPGSVRSILAGGSPTPLEGPDLAQLEQAVREISANPNRSAPLRQWADSLLEQITRLREADQQEARERGA
ncbi:helix-turn-helix transcriptional regulator [Micromonospora tulbaghiae]|uniref:helix-turn-helix transcriptional regulator n=1 Tax=Micromonospora tulbaghiae TaxID=479978 RepID=UPI0033F20504